MNILRRGTLRGLHRMLATGIVAVEIEDDVDGGTLIPCLGTAMSRCLEHAFGEEFVGERIYYALDDDGGLEGFTPAANAAPEMISEYEAIGAKREKKEQGRMVTIHESLISRRPEPYQYN